MPAHGIAPSQLNVVLPEYWWAAVASITRRTGDLEIAEDAVQEACAAAVAQWPSDGIPPNPRAWLITTARHKAVDLMRREALRVTREAEAARELAEATSGQGHAGLAGLAGVASASEANASGQVGEDELALIFACCHPAFDPAVRIALTLRAVCGLRTEEIAAAFLVPEPTMAQRLVRAKRKIRQAGIPLGVPGPDALAERLNTVLRVVYLVFTQGHRATGTAETELIRADLCDHAIGLARQLRLVLPAEPEVTGLLALLLLTDARRAARTRPDGSLVLLADQDRALWDKAEIAEGEQLVESALRSGRPGPYQLHAAIAACHSTAPSAEQTDWREIAAPYRELARHEPTAVVMANLAVAVAMAESPESGLAILDQLAAEGRLERWPQLHIARAELLRTLGRCDEASAAYKRALEARLPAAEREFITERMAETDVR
ncbi:MAG: RNA polymerase sigma factor [Nocardiopsaceae bacterium]|jgi:RNA polymerase sigma-70 factor (ECF subfamily)|nr:RNA polymerase sigma factor [Nocardiopsaceae bacterium]